MKHFAFLKPALFATIAVFALSSCDKDKDEDSMTLPQISFKTTAGYVSKDTTVAKGATVLTGITAAKSETDDVLKRFVINRRYDGADTVGTDVYQEELTGTNGDTYTYDYTIQTRNAVGKEQYTYTVVNRDGLVNTVKLTVTTQ